MLTHRQHRTLAWAVIVFCLAFWAGVFALGAHLVGLR